MNLKRKKTFSTFLRAICATIVYFLIAFFSFFLNPTLHSARRGEVAMSGEVLIIDNCLLKH